MEIILLSLLLWIGCAAAGACAGMGRKATAGGFGLGLILGPIGVIAALGLDDRYQCPNCEGRLDGEGKICQHCGITLYWFHGAPRLEPVWQVDVNLTTPPPRGV